MNNIDESLSTVTKEAVDELLYPMVGVYEKGICIELNSGNKILYGRNVSISTSNSKYILDDGFMIETIPLSDVKDFEVLK